MTELDDAETVIHGSFRDEGFVLAPPCSDRTGLLEGESHLLLDVAHESRAVVMRGKARMLLRGPAVTRRPWTTGSEGSSSAHVVERPDAGGAPVIGGPAAELVALAIDPAVRRASTVVGQWHEQRP